MNDNDVNVCATSFFHSFSVLLTTICFFHVRAVNWWSKAITTRSTKWRGIRVSLPSWPRRRPTKRFNFGTFAVSMKSFRQRVLLLFHLDSSKLFVFCMFLRFTPSSHQVNTLAHHKWRLAQHRLEEARHRARARHQGRRVVDHRHANVQSVAVEKV